MPKNVPKSWIRRDVVDSAGNHVAELACSTCGQVTRIKGDAKQAAEPGLFPCPNCRVLGRVPPDQDAVVRGHGRLAILSCTCQQSPYVILVAADGEAWAKCATCGAFCFVNDEGEPNHKLADVVASVAEKLREGPKEGTQSEATRVVTPAGGESH